jgi:hypothetical protein
MPAALSTEFDVTAMWAICASLIAGAAAAAGLVVSGAGATAGGGVDRWVLGLLAAGYCRGDNNRGERTKKATVGQTGGRHGFGSWRVVDSTAAL